MRYRSLSFGLQFFALLICIGLQHPLLVSAETAEATCEADGTCQAAVPVCVDKREECIAWASQGECDANPRYMLVDCQKSCFVCGEDYGSEMPTDGSDLGVAQKIGNPAVGSRAAWATERMERIRRYMEATPVEPDIKAICRNGHAECINWAVAGECDENQLFMKKNCAPSCFSCEYLAVERRCPVDLTKMPDTWKSGDLDAMFERLTSEPYLSKYEVQTLSSPATGGPWVVQFDNVLSQDEADHMIELGAIRGYTRSADVGLLKADGTHDSKISTTRTSTNAWCLEDCYKNSTAQAVLNRLADITGIPDENSEYLQLLRYEPGQYYGSHHDYIPHHVIRQQGVRILTFFLYLNEVDAGGGTNFDKLNITVVPRVGRAVLWPSVLNDAPNKKDDRTMHQALPVEAGIKYGANAWFHMRDFKGPMANQCQ